MQRESLPLSCPRTLQSSLFYPLLLSQFPGCFVALYLSCAVSPHRSLSLLYLLSQRCHMALRPSPLQTQFSVPAPFALHTALHQLLPWLFISFLSHFSFRDQILLPHSLTVTTLHTRTCATLGTAQCPRNSLGHLGYQPRAGKILYSSDCRVRNNPAITQ